MKETKTYCDKCGEEFDGFHKIHIGTKWTISYDVVYWPSLSDCMDIKPNAHLCLTCLTNLINWKEMVEEIE